MMNSSNKNITWRLHLASPPNDVYRMLSTDEGRARFWAESAIEQDQAIHFVFPNGQEWRGKIIERVPDERYVVEYIDGSIASFDLESDDKGGTLLILEDSDVGPAEWAEVYAGWVSVLMALKAAVDHGIDLRNHDPLYSWDDGYVEN